MFPVVRQETASLCTPPAAGVLLSRIMTDGHVYKALINTLDLFLKPFIYLCTDS